MTRNAMMLSMVVVGSLVVLAPLASNVSLAADIPNSTETLDNEIDAFLARAKGYIEQVEAVEGKHTVDNTLVPLNEAYIHLEKASNLSQLVENVYPSEPMREAATKAYQRVDEFNTALSLNRNIYEAVADVEISAADPLTQRLVERTLRDYRRAGVDKDEATRNKVKALQEEITKIGQEFDKNIRDGQRFVEVESADELAGLPQDYIDAHQPGDNGKIKITTDYPDYGPVMTYAESEELRKKLYYEFRNRAYPENREVLLMLVARRDELARTLGYENWAEYITEDKMTKSAETVNNFLARLDEVTKRPAERDLGMLLELKRQDDPGATEIGVWESAFYTNKLRKQKYDFDPQVLRDYYNYPSVKDGILSLNETLFEIDIRELPGVEVWHPTVDAFEIYDHGELIGRFYLDMHPREGKYSHAAAFPLVSGLTDRQIPEAALICNFPEPDGNGVGLMEHGQVETFLHEFGHLIHMMFSGDQQWIAQSGFATEWDFIEAPSQMLEEWAIDPATLQRFARHYETGEPIPAELIAKLRASREFGQALYVRAQTAYAAISLKAYEGDVENFDPDTLVPEMQKKYGAYVSPPGTHLYTSFGHLNGYSAIVYTYMWSLVIAKDMFSRFNEEDLLNSEIAQEYRAKILAPGGQRDAADMVEDFLGRPYGFEAFALWLEGPGPN